MEKSLERESAVKRVGSLGPVRQRAGGPRKAAMDADSTIEVRGLEGKASHASGTYALSDQLREGHAVFRQVEGDGRGHELSHDGGAWTIALTEDQRKCWAFAESVEPQPWRVPRQEWQVYNGEDWVAASSAFAVSEAQPGAAAQRSLPAGWESSMSRTNGQTYYINAAVRQPCPCSSARAADCGCLCAAFPVARARAPSRSRSLSQAVPLYCNCRLAKASGSSPLTLAVRSRSGRSPPPRPRPRPRPSPSRKPLVRLALLRESTPVAQCTQPCRK